MRINKQAVLDKIEAYYQSVAQTKHDRQLARQERWDQWAAEQADKSPALADALRVLAERVTAGEFVTSKAIDEATNDFAHDRTVPYNERRGRGLDLDWYEFPNTRPEVEPVEALLDVQRTRGRFTDLLSVLNNMVGDDVAVSALQKLGVLDAEDARLSFKASRA